MYNQHKAQMSQILADIPEGHILEQIYSGAEDSLYCEQLGLLASGKGRRVTKHVTSGIAITFHDYFTNQISCQNGMKHKIKKDLLEINYCRYGRIGYIIKDGRSMYLGPSDFCIHMQQLCDNPVLTLPTGHYSGLTIYIDPAQFDKALPKLLIGTGINGKMLYEKFCLHKSFTSFTGNEHTESIFSGFYQLTEQLSHSYFILKTLELILYLGNFQIPEKKQTGRFTFEQINTIREIHDYLLRHLDQRITIEELSRRYLMNPTTLKAAFKTVYGDSLASHMNEHRMEHAAFLLCETTDSLAQIAKAVGYKNQSRFSTAFKNIYQIPPLEYRKIHSLSV